jgi:hypothetical protein
VKSRLFRGLFAVLAAVVLITLDDVSGIHFWATNPRDFAAAAIFVAYGVYVVLSRDPRGRLSISWWEMTLIAAVCGAAIAALVHPGVTSAVAGLGGGVLAGTVAGKWTRIFAHL